MQSLDTWQQLLTDAGSALLERCSALDLGHPGAAEVLRRTHPPELVAAAIELTLARKQAVPKFGSLAQTIFADRQGLQMASSLKSAQHKAQRFKGLGQPVLDLCCGIGADALAFTQAGILVTAIDIDPVRAWMTQQNAGCDTSVGDVTRADLPDGLAHIDPQRRAVEGSRHLPRLTDLIPSFDWVRTLIENRTGACIKLFPGVAFDALPPGEVELVSERGRLRQALHWSGCLAEHARTATSLTHRMSISGSPGPADLGIVGPFLHTVDPAVERAELMGVLAEQTGLTSPHPSSGLLCGDQPHESGFLTPFELIADVVWQPKRARRLMRQLNAGIVEIKTRGGIVDPDRLQRELRGTGEERYTLFIQRFDREQRLFVTRRCHKTTLSLH